MINNLKNTIKKIIPHDVKILIGKILRLFTYNNYDSTKYWKSRAKGRGQSSVLWKNENFNLLYREKQREIISGYMANNIHILDIGCGTGYVAKIMLEINSTMQIDAVDFEEMIIEAKKRNDDKHINYIISSAEEFYDKSKQYDLILSSGCLSAIRDIDKLKQAIKNITLMTKDSGTILMIDPFHKWNYLARAKYSSGDVESLMQKLGFMLVKKSGVIFWPYRERYANSNKNMEILKKEFDKGENILNKLGAHFWADYKILVFKKI